MKPLPVVASPGDSLREQIDDILSGDISGYLAAAVFIVLIAAVEWARWLFQFPPQPWSFTLGAVLWIAITVRQVRKLLRHVRQLKKGLEGEIYVGQYLTSP